MVSLSQEIIEYHQKGKTDSDMEQKVEIIASREQSSMVSCWTECLCLAPASQRQYRLFTGRYEALASSVEH